MHGELSSLSFRQLLGYAIFSENEAAKLYRNLASHIESESLVGHRFESIAKDEEMHMWVLQDLFRETFEADDWEFPKGKGLRPFETQVKIKSLDNLVEALEGAMQNEYRGYRVYKYLAKAHKDHWKVFTYISKNEHSHFDILKREKEHLEDAMIEEPEKFREKLSDMPHMKDYGFRVFG